MSSDGHHVVFIDRSVDDPVIMIMDVDTGHTSKLLSGTAENYQVTQCEFKNDTRVICHFSAWLKTHDAVGRASRMVAINVDRSELKVLSQYGNGSVFPDEIIDMLRDDPRNILIELYEEDAWSPSVFSMDVYTAKLERIVKGAAPVRFWSTDRTGQVRFGWGFEPIAQMLANRGYAVLRINYRGTGGYGRDWLQAGYRDAGTTMLSDVNAGTRWLVAQGIGDPKRICLMGSNTGGYIALLGGIRTPELYRCIVSIGAITDLKEQMWGKGFFYFGERLQIPLKDEQTGEEASPIRHAAQLKLPVLLIHGVLDALVNVEQSASMAKALQVSGNAARLVRIQNGDADLAAPQARLTLMRVVEAFLQKNLPPR